MDRGTSAQRTTRSALRAFITILFVGVLLIGIVAVPAVWLLMEPVYVVQGMVRITPVVRSMLTGEPLPDEVANYPQFVSTQAMLLMSDQQGIQKIADDLVGRHLDFFSGKPGSRIEKLLASIVPRDRNSPLDQILKEAIAGGRITAEYVPDSELMAVSMRDPDAQEAKTIVNSFLRNYVGQYGVEATTTESQNITILENQRNEIQKRILESRAKLRDLANEYGAAALDPLREMDRQRRLQEELAKLELQKIKIEADIGVYERTEKLEMAPEQVVAARTTHINSDPIVKELTTNLIQLEIDQITDQQTSLPSAPAVAKKDSVLDALKKKLNERRVILADEFDSGLENKLKEAALQRVVQAKTEKTHVEAYIDRIREALGNQETKIVKVGNTNLDIQDLQRKLTMDEELLDKVNRRLQSFEIDRDRRPRVQIASLADIKETLDHRRRWTFVSLGAVLLSLIVLIVRRALRHRPQPAVK